MAQSFDPQMGNLQKRLASGAFNPYGSELGDGEMARLAAQELRTGNPVDVPLNPQLPSRGERVIEILRELFAIITPVSGLVADEKDRPHWKFRRGQWIDPAKEKKRKKKSKSRTPKKAAKKRNQ